MALPTIPVAGCYIGTSLGGNTFVNYNTELNAAVSTAKFAAFRNYYHLDSTAINAADTAAGTAGAYGWFSFRADSGTANIVYPWNAIAAGTHDAKIVAIANALHTYANPCWVTFNHEPVHSAKSQLTTTATPPKNVNVCSVTDDSTPALAATIASEWRAAYEHFVNTVKARYVAQGWTLNIAFAPIMQQLNFFGSRLPASQWVPSVGVDWFAIDAYPAPGASFFTAFQTFNNWAVVNLPGVPLANCETTTQPTGRPAWLYTTPAASGSMNYDLPHKMPMLKMWFYWNQNGGSSDFDSGGSDAASITAMGNLILAPGVATSGGTVAAPVAAAAPAMLPANPLDTNTLTISSLGTWTDVDGSSTYRVRWYHHLGTSGAWLTDSTVGPTTHATALAATRALSSADVGYQWRIGVIANNGTNSAEAFSPATSLVVAPTASVNLEVTVE